MTPRYYHDAAGNYLGCYIAADVVETSPVTGDVLSTAPAAPPWAGAIEHGRPPADARQKHVAGVWAPLA